MNDQKKAYIYALTAILFWSTVGVAFKITLRYVDFMQLLFFASSVGLLCFTIFAIAKKTIKELFKISLKDVLTSAFIGFLNPYLYYIVLLKAYSMLPAQLAQPLNYLWPAMLVLLSAPLLGEKLKLKSVISIVLGLTGVYIISTRGNLFNYRIEEPLGVALAAGSSIIWALSWILNQKDKRKEQNKLFWSFLFGLIYTVITILIFSDFKLPEIEGKLALLYVGLFEMGITFFLWLKALQLTERNDRISNLVFLSPFLALIFIHLVLGENIYYTTFIGLLLIVIGIFVQQLKKKNKTGI